MSSAVWRRAPGSPKLAAGISGGLAMNRASPCFGIALLLCLLPAGGIAQVPPAPRSEKHTSELQSLMRISYAVFCLKKKIDKKHNILSTSETTKVTHTYTTYQPH